MRLVFSWSKRNQSR